MEHFRAVAVIYSFAKVKIPLRSENDVFSRTADNTGYQHFN